MGLIEDVDKPRIPNPPAKPNLKPLAKSGTSEAGGVGKPKGLNSFGSARRLPRFRV